MNDLDLMLLADGEADPSTADRATAAAASERSKIEGIQELGGLVRGHLELSADDAEDRLASLWDLVERRLDADAGQFMVKPAGSFVTCSDSRREGQAAGVQASVTGSDP